MKSGYHWKLVELKAAAAPYQHRYQFKQGNLAAYKCACRNGLLDIVCGHMVPSPYKTSPKWTLELLIAEAIKYETRWAFNKGSNNAYCSAWRRGLLDEACAHMVKK